MISDAVREVLAARADGNWLRAYEAESALTDLMLRDGQFEPDRMIEAVVSAAEIAQEPRDV